MTRFGVVRAPTPGGTETRRILARRFFAIVSLASTRTLVLVP